MSASTDGTAVVWTKSDGHNFSPTLTLKGHQSTVTFADGIHMHNVKGSAGEKSLIIATASVDCTVKIWRKHDNEGNSFKYSIFHHHHSFDCLIGLGVCVFIHHDVVALILGMSTILNVD